MNLHDVYMQFSLGGLSLSATFLTVLMANYDPYSPNPCISTGADNTNTNHRLPSAYTFATAVIALVGLRLKRIKLKDERGGGTSVVGVFGGKLHDGNEIKTLLKDYLDAENMNRGLEYVGHLVAVIAGFSFLGSNGFEFTSAKCDGDFNSFALIFAVIAYYCSFLAELADGLTAPAVSHPVHERTDDLMKHMFKNTYASLTTLGLFGIALLSFLRLSRAHDTAEHVKCKHNAVVITLTLAATVLGFVTMVTIRVKQTRTKLQQLTANTFGWGFTMITLVLILMSYSHRDQVTSYAELDITTNTSGVVNTTTVPAKDLNSTLCAYIKDGEWVKDTESDDLLMAQLILVALFGVGGAILAAIFKMAGTASAKVVPGSAEEEDRFQGKRPADGRAREAPFLRPPADGLARNRLTGDGKKPYTSVSTLQFV